jgi:ribosomal protein L12E/L44/L45/RPP1/RPP2
MNGVPDRGEEQTTSSPCTSTSNNATSSVYSTLSRSSLEFIHSTLTTTPTLTSSHIPSISNSSSSNSPDPFKQAGDISIYFSTTTTRSILNDPHAIETTCTLLDAKAKLPPKRIKQRNQYRIVPRAMYIVRQDTRRQYATMLLNVLNSYQSELITAFLVRYATPTMFFVGDLQHIVKKQADFFQNPTLSLTPRLVVRGVQAAASFLVGSNHLSPDRIFRIAEDPMTHVPQVTLKTFSNTECCELTATFIITGTYLYVVSPISLAETVQQARKKKFEMKRKEMKSREMDRMKKQEDKCGDSQHEDKVESTSVNDTDVKVKHFEGQGSSNQQSSMVGPKIKQEEIYIKENSSASPLLRKRSAMESVDPPPPSSAPVSLSLSSPDPKMLSILEKAMPGANIATVISYATANPWTFRAKIFQATLSLGIDPYSIREPMMRTVQALTAAATAATSAAASSPSSISPTVTSNEDITNEDSSESESESELQQKTSSTPNSMLTDRDSPVPLMRLSSKFESPSTVSNTDTKINSFIQQQTKLTVPVQHTMRVHCKLRINANREIEWIHFVQD